LVNNISCIISIQDLVVGKSEAAVGTRRQQNVSKNQAYQVNEPDQLELDQGSGVELNTKDQGSGADDDLEYAVLPPELGSAG
jgi:hypothetical protein